MIFLDTNVISEPLRARPVPAVQHWLDRQLVETLFVTAVSVSELLLGVATLPQGRRRDALDADVRRSLSDLFGSRILPFDEPAAFAYADLMARARADGMTIGTADGQIAAIARVHGFAVATRDAAPFAAAGVAVIDPWTT